jgi:hypothetical protein
MIRYPKMRVETVSEARMIDIVAEGYDAGIRLEESIPQIRQLVTATPLLCTSRHSANAGRSAAHQGIGMRMAHGGIYRWELARRGNVRACRAAALCDVRSLLPRSAP